MRLFNSFCSCALPDTPSCVQARQQAQLLQQVADGRREFTSVQEALRDARKGYDEAVSRLRELRKQEESVSARLLRVRTSAELSAAQRLAEGSELELRRTELVAAVSAAEVAVARAEERVNAEEHRVAEAEVVLSRKAEGVGAAAAAEQERIARQRTVADSRAAAEAALAARTAAKMEATAMTTLEETAEFEATLMDRLGTSTQIHNAAAARVAETAADRQAIRDAVEDMRVQQRNARVSAILSLKTNTERATSEIQTANARRAAANARKEAAHAAEYHALLDAGLNPYEVWRARERDAGTLRAQVEHERRVAEHKLVVAQKVIVEDEKSRRLEALARHEAEAAEAYNKSISRPVRDARVTAYMLAKTKDHTEFMDPTGRATRIEPSEVTALKPSAFGLGRLGAARPDIVEAIAARHDPADVQLDPRWIPKRAAIDGDDGVSKEDGSPAVLLSLAATSRAAAADVAAVHALDDTARGEDGDAHGASTGSLDATGARAKKYPQRQLSKYEQRLMAQARERQRTGIVKKQVAAGKEYKGTSKHKAMRRLTAQTHTRAYARRWRLEYPRNKQQVSLPCSHTPRRITFHPAAPFPLGRCRPWFSCGPR